MTLEEEVAMILDYLEANAITATGQATRLEDHVNSAATAL